MEPQAQQSQETQEAPQPQESQQPQSSQKTQQKYRALQSEKEYMKDLVATAVSRFGDSIDAIAYTWMIYAVTGSTALAATTFGVNVLVSVLLQPFSAALITNWNKKAVMVAASIGRGLLVCLTATLFYLGLLQPWMILTVTALISTLEAFHQPASMAVVPQILSKEKYTLGISLSGALNRTCELAGTALAGTLIAFLGIHGALLVDAFTFFFAGAVLAILRLPPAPKSEAPNAWKAFLQNTKEGFAYVRGHSLALAICFSACFLNLAFVPFSALQAAYVSESLQLDAQALSAMGLLLSAGMVLGSAVYPKLTARMPRFRLYMAGVFLLSASCLALGAIPFADILWLRWALLMGVCLFMGIASAFANTSVQVSFMEKIEPEYLARASGIMNSMVLAAMPVGSFVIASLAASFSVVSILLGFGMFSVCVAFGFFAVKPLRDL